MTEETQWIEQELADDFEPPSDPDDRVEMILASAASGGRDTLCLLVERGSTENLRQAARERLWPTK